MVMGAYKVLYSNSNSNNNYNEHISRVPFHVKHAQLCRTGANTKIKKTLADKAHKTTGVQTVKQKHPTKQFKKKYP